GGVEVEFFGERTLLPGGPATLALRTGASILPTAVYQDGPTHRGVVLPPVPAFRQGRLRADVARVTQDLAWALEELIRAAPEQWHLMQPNWASDADALHAFRRQRRGVDRVIDEEVRQQAEPQPIDLKGVSR
ncbi:MAG: hypothetical protein OXF00_10050, partial [bacterium]|nr:hypothetical protein [bacterium]